MPDTQHTEPQGSKAAKSSSAKAPKPTQEKKRPTAKAAKAPTPKGKSSKAKTAKTSAAKNGSAANATAVFDAAAAGLDMGKNYSDVALAGLCQSYAHALSMAFQETVLQQQRRNALAQAAVATALARIDRLDGDKVKEHLREVKEGLDLFGISENEDMAAFAGITRQFQEAADRLLAVRKQAGLE